MAILILKKSTFLVGYVQFCFLFFAASSLAQPVSAIVEDIQPPSAGISQYDYVTLGRVINLGSDGSLTLGYLVSCERERIEGGLVTIGREESIVQGGVKAKRNVVHSTTRHQ